MTAGQAVFWILLHSAVIVTVVWVVLEIRSINSSLDVVLGCITDRLNKLENEQ